MPKTSIQSFTQNDYEIVKRNVVYEGIFRMAQYFLRHKLFNGGWSKTILREVMERPSAVAVLPYDPNTNKVVLIEQFRAGALSNPKSPWLIEIVAGIFDKDESPAEVAIREAKEEAGCEITKLHPVTEYFVSPGACNEHIKVFIGQVDASNVAGNHGMQDEHEDIHAFTVSIAEASEMVADGTINSSPAIISLLWLQLNRERLLTLWQLK